MSEATTETQISPKKEEKFLSKEKLTLQEKEIRGVWEAIQLSDRLAKDKRRPINEQVVRDIHKRVMRHFHPEIAGRYRDYEVGVKRAIFLPPHWSEVRSLMWQFGKDLETKTSGLSASLSAIENVLRIGAWAHYQFVRIHPFADGNGRTARLLSDLIFKRVGLYYITDWGSKGEEYINVLKRVDESGDLGYFVRFLAAKLGKRFDEVEAKLTRSTVAKIAANSQVLRNLQDRRAELFRILKSQGGNSEINIK